MRKEQVQNQIFDFGVLALVFYIFLYFPRRKRVVTIETTIELNIIMIVQETVKHSIIIAKVGFFG